MFCSETLPVEYLGGKPLCMNQYYEVLSSCRIPGLKKDSVVNHAKSSRPPKHITVVHNFEVRSCVCAPLGSRTSVQYGLALCWLPGFTGPDISADCYQQQTLGFLEYDIFNTFSNLD